MRFGRRHCLWREWQSERRSAIPRLPLIHVVRAEKISALAGHNIQSRLIEVGEISREALRGSVMAADVFYRVSAARLLLNSGTAPPIDEGNLPKDRVLNFDRIEFAPVPGSQILRHI